MGINCRKTPVKQGVLKESRECGQASCLVNKKKPPTIDRMEIKWYNNSNITAILWSKSGNKRKGGKGWTLEV